MIILNQKLNIKSTRAYIPILEQLKLARGKVRLVGGVIRDSLLGNVSADIDIITDLLPEQVTAALASKNLKVIPTGIKFGTVTAIMSDESFEITTLRKDIKSNGRHVEVEFTNDFYLDAERRDFTINALSYCPFEHKIYDYFTGLDDLKQKKVVFIGRAEERITEDYLRILRFFRFSSRFASSIDKGGLEACVTHKKSLHNLSRERIKAEMDLLLANNKSALETLKIMFETGILQEALPINRLHYKQIKAAVDFSEAVGVKMLPQAYYALLFSNNNLMDIQRLLALKFSRLEAKTIYYMLSLPRQLSAADEWQIVLRQSWWEYTDWQQCFIVAAANNESTNDIKELYNQLCYMTRRPFPIRGKELIKMGYSGRQLGKVLDFAKKQWIKGNFLLSKQDLIKLIKTHEK